MHEGNVVADMDEFFMSMKSPFDSLALSYDQDFTQSEIGILMRRHVMRYLKNRVLKDRQCKILEIACGTGEDAIELYTAGHSVMATDLSGEMIRVAKSKIKVNDHQEGICFQQSGFKDLMLQKPVECYDLVFSNFGGLNCIGKEELKLLTDYIYTILKPGGGFVGVIMPKFSLWEFFFFTMKGSLKKAFRRSKKGAVSIELSGNLVQAWFHSPKTIRNLSGKFRVIAIKPVGIALPPPSLEPFFKKYKRLLFFFNLLESAANKIPFLAYCSDHFLFDLVKS